MITDTTLILRKDLASLRASILPILQRLMRRDSITGASLALVDGAGLAWAEGFGYADKESGAPATQDTIYKISSLTKLFTAIAVMQLAEHGKLDLDQPLQFYIPKFSIKSRFPQSGPVTVRSLMTHHAGLPADNRRGLYARRVEEWPEPYQAALEYLKNTYSAYPVNTIFSYSNLGADLLGILIEKISGERYEDYLEQHMLGLLGMDRSFIWPEPPIQDGISKGYHHGKGTWEPMIREIPAGGLHSTVTDMARFAAMCLGQGLYRGVPVLRKESLEQMWTPQNTGTPLDFNFMIGLNWVLSRPSLAYAGQVCWHDGSSQHFNTTLVLLPERRLGVIVLCNSDTGGQTVFQLADEVLKQALQEMRGIQPPTQNGREKVTLPASRRGGLEDYVGEYPSISLGLSSLKTGSNGATLSLKGRQLQLIPQEDGWNRLRFSLFGRIPIPLNQLEALRVSFQTINGEKVMAVEQSGLQTAIARQAARKPVHPAWQKSAGFYRNIDTEDTTLKTFLLKSTPDLLWIEGRASMLGKVKIYLQPLSGDQALTLGLGRSANETVFLREEAGMTRIELFGMVFERI